MNRKHWEVYAIIRNINGKEAAEKYRHTVRAKQRNYKVEETENPWKIIFSDNDGFTKKRFFPYFFDTGEWENYLDYEWIYLNSMYDCTGYLFTVSIDRYETKNGTWVYHKMALDI